MLRKTDFLWLLAYPVYQLAGTLRHEAAHALVARLEGARILEFVWWPTLTEKYGFLWGYVLWKGRTGWMTLAAPYIGDLVTCLIFFAVLIRFDLRPRWLKLNLVVIGLVSPLANSLYNYLGIFRGQNDVGRLVLDLPAPAVHAYFLVTLSLFVIGLVALARTDRRKAKERMSET
jgi:hypothetical protein